MVNTENVGSYKEHRDRTIINAKLEKWIAQGCKEGKPKSIHYIISHIKSHDKSTAGKPRNEIRPKVNVIHILRIQEEERNPVFWSNILSDKSKENTPDRQ